MHEYMENLLKAMRPAFSRQKTFTWFVIVFVGFVMRNDTFGVSSIVRALWSPYTGSEHTASKFRNIQQTDIF